MMDFDFWFESDRLTLRQFTVCGDYILTGMTNFQLFF